MGRSPMDAPRSYHRERAGFLTGFSDAGKSAVQGFPTRAFRRCKKGRRRVLSGQKKGSRMRHHHANAAQRAYRSRRVRIDYALARQPRPSWTRSVRNWGMRPIGPCWTPQILTLEASTATMIRTNDVGQFANLTGRYGDPKYPVPRWRRAAISTLSWVLGVQVKICGYPYGASIERHLRTRGNFTGDDFGKPPQLGGNDCFEPVRGVRP